MHVEEVMSRNIRTIDQSETLEHAWYLLEAHGFRHLVVTGQDKGAVVGIISSNDITALPPSTRQNRLIRDFMSTDIVQVRPEATIRDAANLFRGHQVNCLPVMEDNQLLGLITTTDLLELIGRGHEGEYPISQRHRHQVQANRHQRGKINRTPAVH